MSASIPRNRQSDKLKRYDILVEDEQGNKISLTKIQFKANKYNIQIQRRLAEIEQRVKFAVYHHFSHGKKFDAKKIKDFIYGEESEEVKTSNGQRLEIQHYTNG